MRDLQSPAGKPLAGTEGAICTPIFSPDGKWLAFLADGKLQKISVIGGAPITLASVEGFNGASWGDDDNIVIGMSARGILSVSAAGGSLQPITKVDTPKGELGHRFPQVLPGAKAVLFAATFSERLEDTKIVVQDLRTSARHVVAQGGTYPHYVPAGYVVYAQAGTLMAVPFDLDRLQVTGAAVPVAENVLETGLGAAEFGSSRTGSLVYVPGGVELGQRKLVWVDRKGAAQPLAAPPRPYGLLKLSPDGRRVVVQIPGARTTLWVFDIARETLTQLAQARYPVWTPDGKRVAFTFQQNIFWKPADGSSAEERLATTESQGFPVSWSADNRFLSFLTSTPETRQDIWVLPLDGDPSRPAGTGAEGGKPSPWLATRSNETAPMFSPDSRWLAYVSNESGRYEVYVRPYPGPGEKWQISSEGGRQPAWAHSGRELFFRIDDKMMVVDVTTGPSFSVGKPRMLFEGSYTHAAGSEEVLFSNYDVAPDDQRFLMIEPSQQERDATQINVVLNWFEELKQKVPTAQ
ncbi:MAG: PD40 domain-containing protein [Acidobacteria bacterium]|nr:PD40 domain-containing protein [Acidobacteriota bacterium]